MSGMYFSGYDRALTVFSPDGRLYQVEYAMEPVRKGWTTVGVRVNEGVAMVAEKKSASPLVDVSATEKIMFIDRHVAASYAGISSDARILVDQARVFAQAHRITYDEEADVESITRKIGDTLQAYTQHGGVRPFGVALLVGGVSHGTPALFLTDSSGAYSGYKATAIGMFDQAINDYLREHYSPTQTVEEAALLALRAMLKAQSEAQQTPVVLDPEKLEVGFARQSTRLFVRLSEADVSTLLDKIQEGSPNMEEKK